MEIILYILITYLVGYGVIKLAKQFVSYEAYEYDRNFFLGWFAASPIPLVLFGLMAVLCIFVIFENLDKLPKFTKLRRIFRKLGI